MNPEIGNTIWKQLSIGTKMACGARQPYLLEEGIEFRAGRELRVSIKLTPMDTYTVEAYRLKRGTCEKIVLETHEDVYVDNLNEIVYHAVNK